MAHEKIVTYFDTIASARQAMADLTKAGFAERDMDLLGKEQLKAEGKDRHTDGRSFWQRLFGSEVEHEDAEVYSRAIDNDGVVLTLRTDANSADKALRIIESYDKIPDPSGARSAESVMNAKACNNDRPAVSGAQTATNMADQHEKLKLAEEELEVGKRVYKSGTTRVRRYMTEKQVDADVTLREEHAKIARQSVNQAADPSDIDWSDKVVEVTETDEKPVVSKTARIVEEVSVGKEGSERVEKVSDTVRKQQVDVEHNELNDPARNRNSNTTNRQF